MKNDIICQTSKLTKSYGKAFALKDVDFQLKKGDIYGLIGENGAGRTTLIKILAGIIFPTEGEVELFGGREARMLERARTRVGFTIENPAIYDDMTARENMMIQCRQRGISDGRVVDNLLEMVGLEGGDRKKTKRYSLGMKQRLAIGMALLGEPEILVLDEPVNGLDPMGIMELRELLTKLNRERGVTIVISSHILGELHKLAACYGILHRGKMIAQMTASQLDEKCQKYLRIRVHDVSKALDVLRTMGIRRIENDGEGGLRIYDCRMDSGELNDRLVQNGIRVKELVMDSGNLETFFFHMIKEN